jgi:osmotically-inducible protein OsmY
MASFPIPSDRALERELRAAIDGAGRVEIRSSRGAVLIAGTVDDETTAARLPIEVERFPGVVSVRAKLSWPRGR